MTRPVYKYFTATKRIAVEEYEEEELLVESPPIFNSNERMELTPTEQEIGRYRKTGVLDETGDEILVLVEEPERHVMGYLEFN